MLNPFTGPSPRQSPPALVFEALVERYAAGAIEPLESEARIRLTVRDDGACGDAVVSPTGARLEPCAGTADASLAAPRAVWERLLGDLREGMTAFRRGELVVRENLHLGVGFLAAIGGAEDDERRLRFSSIETREGMISAVSAGAGEPVLCLHGLGGTKASFLPTVSALAERHRVISIDLPGFGESDKPIAVPYDAPYFARRVLGVLEALGLDRVHLIGNSMGGRIALEVALQAPERVGALGLLSPALAWLRDRRWAWLLSLPLPRLGLVQPAPRWATDPLVRRLVPGADSGWTAAGVDDFLRIYATPRGRNAFYQAARNIYMDEPHGETGFWTRLAELRPPSLFVWGRKDTLVPIGFMKHAQRVLPEARHLELNCGHVPQLERPSETHAALAEQFAAWPLQRSRRRRGSRPAALAS